jgi:hypothetical protein
MPKTAPFETHVNRYEDWFTKYPEAYAAELRAVQPLVPKNGCLSPGRVAAGVLVCGDCFFYRLAL